MGIRKIAGMLMIISGVTYNLQLLVYAKEGHVLGAAAFGIACFIIGLMLLRYNRVALWWGAILPTISGILGIYRFMFFQPNGFSIFHVGIDLIVVPICIYLLRKPSR